MRIGFLGVFAPLREIFSYNSGMTNHTPPRVLVAEYNPHGAELLEAYLSDTDYEVRTVADGEATLSTVRDWQPDLVLLDVMMPKLSGFEVCKRLRLDPATRHTSVIMVTALDEPSDVDRAVEAGTNDFLTKPINKAELLLRIKAMLATRRGQDLPDAIDYINAVQRQ
jgi:two-component system alkaline phosphatase synthesis response regulator PhoP